MAKKDFKPSISWSWMIIETEYMMIKKNAIELEITTGRSPKISSEKGAPVIRQKYVELLELDFFPNISIYSVNMRQSNHSTQEVLHSFFKEETSNHQSSKNIVI